MFSLFCLVNITTIYIHIQGRNLDISSLLTMIYSISNQALRTVDSAPWIPTTVLAFRLPHCYYLGPNLQYYFLKRGIYLGLWKDFLRIKEEINGFEHMGRKESFRNLESKLLQILYCSVRKKILRNYHNSNMQKVITLKHWGKE